MNTIIKIFKELNKKGYEHYYGGTVEELDSMDKDNQYLHSEIMQVIMWLYEKHGIWISTQKDWDCGHCFGFDATIDSNCGIINTDTFSTPEEAYEASIGYTLNNLI